MRKTSASIPTRSLDQRQHHETRQAGFQITALGQAVSDAGQRAVTNLHLHFFSRR